MIKSYTKRSVSNPEKTYIGVTKDLRIRLKEHNAGRSFHTKKYRPWEIEIYVSFKDELLASKFEIYLKNGSGREFARRHFKR